MFVGVLLFSLKLQQQVMSCPESLTKFVSGVHLSFLFSWVRLQRPVVVGESVYLQECRTGISGGIARIASALPGILRSEEPGSPSMPSIPGIPAEGLISPACYPPPPPEGQAC